MFSKCQYKICTYAVFNIIESEHQSEYEPAMLDFDAWKSAQNEDYIKKIHLTYILHRTICCSDVNSTKAMEENPPILDETPLLVNEASAFDLEPVDVTRRSRSFSSYSLFDPKYEANPSMWFLAVFSLV